MNLVVSSLFSTPQSQYYKHEEDIKSNRYQPLQNSEGIVQYYDISHLYEGIQAKIVELSEWKEEPNRL